MNNKGVKFIVNSAVMAALYIALTLLIAPLSFGVVQVRVSEVLCVLGLFSPAAIPGLTIGCFIANILGPNGMIDAVLGSLATLIGMIGMWLLRKKIYLAPLVNVIANGIIIGCMLHFVYSDAVPLMYCILLVTAEEAACLYILGIPLAKVIQKNAKEIF